MSLLNKATKGKRDVPYHFIIYGEGGVGKSRFASRFDNPIFLDLEDGTNNINCTRISSIQTFDELMATLDELIKTKHGYKTVVVDALDSVEKLVDTKTLANRKENTIKEIPWGQGNSIALNVWQKFEDKIKEISQVMNTVLIGHGDTTKFNDPMQPVAYDRWDLKLENKAAVELLKNSVDLVLFAKFKYYVTETTTGRGKAYGEKNPTLYTQGGPGHYAKERYGLPFDMPLDYKMFHKFAQQGDEEKKEQMLENLKGMITDIKDEKTKAAGAAKLALVKEQTLEDVEEFYEKVQLITATGG